MVEQTAYSAAHADYYDQLQAGEDVSLYRQQAQQAGGPALELACGTGRVYCPVARAGVDVDGLDASAGALRQLRDRAAEAGITPTVWQADMTTYSPDRSYQLVYCPFNSVNHATTVDKQLSLLATVYDTLAPGGSFLFDTFVPTSRVICETYGEWQTQTDGDRRARSRTTFVDEAAQTIQTTTQVTDDGSRVVDDTVRLTMLPPQQLEVLCRHSPFDRWSVADGFETASRQFGESSDDAGVETLTAGSRGVWKLEKTA